MNHIFSFVTTGYIVLLILASLFVLLAFLPRVIRSIFTTVIRTVDRRLGVTTETIDKHGKKRPSLIARWKRFLDAKTEEEE